MLSSSACPLLALGRLGVSTRSTVGNTIMLILNDAQQCVWICVFLIGCEDSVTQCRIRSPVVGAGVELACGLIGTFLFVWVGSHVG